MRLVLYEIKKLTSSKLFIISTLIVAALYVFIMAADFGEDARMAGGFADYINTRVPDTVTPAFAGELTAKDNYNPDDAANDPQINVTYWTEDAISRQLNYAESFRKDMIKTVNNAIQLRNDAAAAGNSYEQAYNEAAIRTYNSVTDISLIDGSSAEMFFMRMHNTSSIQAVAFGPLFIMWAVLLTAYLMCCERGSRTDYISHTAKGGRGAMYLHKLAAVTVVVFAMTLLLFIAEIIYGAVIYRLNYSASIQSVRFFEFCVYRLNILGMIALQRFMLFTAAMFGVFCASLFSIKAATPIRGIVLGFVLVFGSYRIITLLRSLSAAEGIAQANLARMLFPPYMIYPDEYFTSFDYGNLFGIPVPRLAVVIAMTALLGVVCTIICTKLYGRSVDVRWKAKLLSLIKSQKHTEN
ncbi:MAG: hypothetical protein J1E39_06440 [Eubacterium sp.]|nr:hypothetical protein [Eubacterium sp.]